MNEKNIQSKKEEAPKIKENKVLNKEQVNNLPINKVNEKQQISNQLQNKPITNLLMKPINFEEELKYISQTGKSNYQWIDLKNGFIEQYKKIVVANFPVVMSNANSTNKTINKIIDDEIIEYLNSLNKIPFTIQRMAELLINPTQYYKSFDKYNWAYKKLVNIDPD